MTTTAETIGQNRPASRARPVAWEYAGAGVILGVLSLAMPVLIVHLLDFALLTGQLWLLSFLALALVAAAAGGALVKNEIRRIFELPTGNAGRSDRLSRIVADPFLRVSEPLQTDLLSILVQIGGLAAIAWMLAVPVAAFGLPALMMGYVAGRRAFDRMGHAPDRPILRSTLAGLMTIKALGAERRVAKLLGQEAAQQQEQLQTYGAGITAGGVSCAAVTTAATGISITGGAVLAIEGYATPGEIFAAAWITAAVIPLVFRLGSNLRRRKLAAQVNSDAPARVYADAMSEPDQADDRPALPQITGNILLNNLGASASPAAPGLAGGFYIDNVNLEIPQGECLRITGDDRGKIGGLLRLIAGIDVPERGQVLVDGHDLKEFRPSSITRRIAYVPSLAPVFPGSVMDNLTAFQKDRAVDATGAARLSGLDRIVSAMPDGYDTELTGDPDTYPAGFRQHLGIARALAIKPKILILDFAAEDMDSRDFRTLTGILERLKGRVTMIFASTQMGLHLLADREIDINQLPVKLESTPEETDADASDEPDGDDQADGGV